MFEALQALVHILLMAKAEFQCEVEYLNYMSMASHNHCLKK
jgi:hypothetical protein